MTSHFFFPTEFPRLLSSDPCNLFDGLVQSSCLGRVSQPRAVSRRVSSAWFYLLCACYSCKYWVTLAQGLPLTIPSGNLLSQLYCSPWHCWNANVFACSLGILPRASYFITSKCQRAEIVPYLGCSSFNSIYFLNTSIVPIIRVFSARVSTKLSCKYS